MSTEIKIDNNIPVPAKRRNMKYPYKDMAINDSFFVENVTIQLMCNLNYRASKKYGGKYLARSEEGGVRVWRTN